MNHFDTLALIVTRKCTSQCSICCLECGPHSNGKLPMELTLSCIEQASKINGINSVGISGGEPFIYFDELLAWVSASKSHKLMSSCTTNGYWATNPTITRKKLSQLQNAGLTAIKVSMDIFHQEYVPLENIRNIITSSKEIGLFCQTQCVVTRSSEHLKDILPQLEEAALLIRFIEIPCVPVGRASRKIAPTDFIYRNGIPEHSCRLMNDLTVLPNGEVYPCCSQGGFTPPLRLGSATDMPLAQLVERFQEDALYRRLLQSGPAWFLRAVQEAGLSSRLQQRYVDVCHLCHDLLSDPEIATVAREAAEVADNQI